ncbi:MAG: hypothetical protein KIS68_08630 [Bauldia sp.]|nr:hypothetical protein [Bauldia sp.]
MTDRPQVQHADVLFHLIEDGHRVDDPDGSGFDSFEMAYLDTYRAVRDMWCEMVKHGKDPSGCSFEIVDADAMCLAVVRRAA